MFKWIKEANEAVRRGNAYRQEKGHVNDSISESFQKAKEATIKYVASLPKRKQGHIQQDDFRLKFQFWDEWTGARYVRRENPITHMDNYEFIKSPWSNEFRRLKPKVEMGSICRSCPVTGDWVAL